MATMRTSLRDLSRPTAVDESEAYEPHHSRSKQHGRRRQRTKQPESAESSQAVTTQPKEITTPISDRDNTPSLELNIMKEPEEKIAFGKPVRMDILISLRYPQHYPSVNPMHLNYSRLITFVTVVADGQNGERVPMEPSVLSAQKTCDTVHSFQQPEKHSTALWNYFPDRLPLGYSSFPDLRIARPGVYRFRITLMRTGGSAEEGAVNIACIDSNPINFSPPVTRRR